MFELLSLLLNILFADIKTTLISLSVGYVVYYLSNFYKRVYRLPPGPLPLPIIGNLLLFRRKEHTDKVFRSLNEKYGPVFTLWFGDIPTVIITDIDIAKDTFGKYEFGGRQRLLIASSWSNDEHQDINFTNYGKTWEHLRRVTHSAVQKYSSNEKLNNLVIESVDETIELIISKQGVNKEFQPNVFISHLYHNIITISAIGKKYSMEDEESILFKSVLVDMLSNQRMILWECSSFIRMIDRCKVNKCMELSNNMITRIKKYFKSHYKDYEPSIERDFCDALITAKNDALRDGKESALYLKDENLALCVFDLIIGGTLTSQLTFQWMINLMAYYPEVQKMLRQEIENQIGDRLPTHEDRNRCHYVMAFIAETLRFRNPTPGGVGHEAMSTSNIREYSIPKGTGVIVYQSIILTDERNWRDGQVFRPERFLENGEYMKNKPKAYIPFGVGRRVCLGERLAIADLFLVLVRFLQMTNEYNIVLGSNQGIEANPNIGQLLTPHDNYIIFQSK